MNDFTRVVNPGYTSLYAHGSTRDVPVTVEIEYINGRLSLCGSYAGGGGQIDVAVVETLSPGWTPEMLTKLGEVWKRWHLNDMRPACEHQRAEGWGKEEIEVVTYRLTSEAWKLRRKAENEAIHAAAIGKAANLNDVERALLAFDLGVTHHSPPDADGPLSGMLEVEKREVKHAGWVRPNEHQRGVLTKPCPVCGYKYGTAWLREDVPEEVLEWLKSLPETTVKPAWV